MSAITYESCPKVGVRFHEYAELFPLIEGRQNDDFVEDIRKNGVQEPIVFMGEFILDGRNRYLAARQLGIEYPRVEFDGDDPLAFVLSKNMARRQLSESQRSMVAARIAKLPVGSNQHLSQDTPTVATAARAMNVSEASVARAKRVQAQGDDALISAVDAGRVRVGVADQIATLPKEEQASVVALSDKEILERAKAIRGARSLEKREKAKANAVAIAEGNAALPLGERRYGVIYADPPWSHETWSDTGTDRSAINHYPTMAQAELEALQVGDLAANDCVLLMWAVSPRLPDALSLIKAWGFEYKTIGFGWCKTVSNADNAPSMGMGYWTRSSLEVCLLATRGKPTRLHADVLQAVFAPRGEHSQKPDEVAARIERLVPGPYIELFARSARPGWDVWGNQAGGDDA